MALSDHVSFHQISVVHGLSPDQVKQVMRKNLAPGSYRAWRKRVRQFSDQRATYK
ncbi:MAG: TIGR03643 family protein [Oxalobacteraceae bacterium]|nr:TIGR03643 family protein [Oxalobacteraceae bacterium]